MEDIRTVTLTEALNIMKKGQAKAIVVDQDNIRVVDLPKFGAAALRMVNHKLDRVEYSYSKK